MCLGFIWYWGMPLVLVEPPFYWEGASPVWGDAVKSLAGNESEIETA